MHQIRLLSLDIDNTTIVMDTKKSFFTKAWASISPTDRPVLCYNTGRLLEDAIQLVKKGYIPEPDFIISGVGTNIFDYKAGKLLKAFNEILEEGWDLSLIKQTIEALPYPIADQPSRFQHAYKQSYFFEAAKMEDVQNVEMALKEKSLDVNVIYSGDRFLDVLPKWANKGNALTWLLDKLNIDPSNSLVAGDSGNDSAMFKIPNIKGIVVGNAQEELYQSTKHLEVYQATESYSRGLIEGLHFYQVISKELWETLKSIKIDFEAVPEEFIEHLDEAEFEPINQEEKALIVEGYFKAIEAVKYNITPLGFAACSPTHNSSNGTDENYRSVWARDGSITIIGTIPLLHDPEIDACHRNTFETLLNHMTNNGQIPSNVSIDNDHPDYSGVGGICSIDSGLWFVIAFYEYIKATKDYAFLRKHIDKLKLIMQWLGAQDGNNDALLEVPEAGDWTDLFGRSYNVLYDEVLWYRANICFGRLLEKLGDDEAGHFIRWAQVIRKEILHNFWPTTRQKLFQSVSFAEQQYSIGDARYLIAQITPFDFSWRCDVYGNILAFLYNVLDQEKALLAFRFMWGVGANEPYPVTNVYPVVTPGDPDWRPYYTVNLLNLPNHYHNGGIWPFVGASWVQFIHKLGLNSIAQKELYKLAQLNKLGVQHEWEFNEWAHGDTGRPMGKFFQAWSAAQYIKACHQLKIIK